MLKKYMAVGLLSVLSLGVVSCGSPQEVSEVKAQEVVPVVRPDENQLKVRVQERWDALIKRDFAGAYRYLSPAYRKLYSVEKYSAGFGSAVGWESISLKELVVDDVRAHVKVDVFYHLSIPAGQGGGLGDELGLISTQMDETWLWIEGEWWYLVPEKATAV